MPAKPNPRPRHVRLLAGFEVKARDDGSVHTVKANGTVVAEVCAGKSNATLKRVAAVAAPAKVANPRVAAHRTSGNRPLQSRRPRERPFCMAGARE